MLARTNRIVRGDDYSRVVRRGRRYPTGNLIIYRTVGTAEATRFGFIVAKSVGNAVVRNRVRRRLKAIAFERLAGMPPAVDIVIRALPGSARLTWATLNSEIADALDRGTRA